MKKIKPTRIYPDWLLVVELEGVEPSSKQGIRRLSTCLCYYWFSYRARKQPS